MKGNSKIFLYNSLTKKKEEFIPLEKGIVKMYNCGPTVYGYQSIGNYRSFLFADVLKRYLKYCGYEVRQIMNITDVGHMTSDGDTGEDKMEKKAKEERKNPWEIAEFYMNEFFKDIDLLKIDKALKYPRATEHIEEMIEIIKKLLDKGYAYEVNGNIYYDLSKFEKYGQLSGNTLDDLIAGARVEVNEEKKNPYDFALWIRNPNHIMQWDAPWGRGYPGWHIECSAMSMKYLGETLDIHTGGEDNKFPHHECEIAQSEGATGKQFVRYWLHVKHLIVNGQKMSKSLGNVYRIRDILEKGYSANELRYLLVSSHYRQTFNFTFEGLDGVKGALKRIDNFMTNLEHAQGEDDLEIINNAVNNAYINFENAMNDDLNFSEAIASFFGFIKDINVLIADYKVGEKGKELIRNFINDFNSVFGFIDLNNEKRLDLTEEEIVKYIEERNSAKKMKDYKKADEIRDFLKEKGIILEDSPTGTRWKIEK